MSLIRKNKNIDNLQLFLVCLIPFGLVFSRFVADLSLVLVCIIFILNYSRNYKFIELNNIFFKLFFIFWILIVVRSLFSEDILFSLKSSFFYIRFLIFVIAIKFLFQLNKNFFYYFFISISFCILAVVLDGYLQLFLKKNIFGYPIVEYQLGVYRLTGFFKDELIIGSFISRMLPFCLGLYMYCRYLNLIKNKDNFVFLFIVLCTILVVLSGERLATFFALLTLVIATIYLNVLNIKPSIKIISLIISFILIISISDQVRNRLVFVTMQQTGLLKITFDNNLLGKLSKKLQTNSEQTKSEFDGNFYIFSIHHHNHILAALKIFKENVFFGSGVKMFRKICDKRYKVKQVAPEPKINEYACSTHPHNLIMQFLSETGIIGFFFYFIALFYVIKCLIFNLKLSLKYLKDNLIKSNIFYLLAFFCYLMPILPSGNFFNNWISIINFFPVGFYLISNLKKNEY